MSPVAQGLDYLQGETAMKMGCLLPAIVVIQKALRDIKSSGTPLKFLTTMLDALIDAMDRRFEFIFKSDEIILSAALHPNYRVKWSEFQHVHEKGITPKKVMSKLEEAVEKWLIDNDKDACNMQEEECDVSTNKNGGCNFLQTYMMQVVPEGFTNTSGRQTPKKKAAEIVRQWIRGKGSANLNDDTFMNQPSLIDLFIRYNTAMPSSAPVERLFSLGKDIARAKRNRLADETFDILMFLKGNYCQCLGEEKPSEIDKTRRQQPAQALFSSIDGTT